HVIHDVGQAIKNSSPTSTFTLTLNEAGAGSGTVTANPAGHAFLPGTIVTVTEAPAAGSTFAGWSGACSGTGSCMVTMNSNLTVTATFNVSQKVNLSVVIAGTGSGTVTAPPTGFSYESGTSVTLTATPNAPSVFAGWGSISG